MRHANLVQFSLRLVHETGELEYEIKSVEVGKLRSILLEHDNDFDMVDELCGAIMQAEDKLNMMLDEVQ